MTSVVTSVATSEVADDVIRNMIKALPDEVLDYIFFSDSKLLMLVNIRIVFTFSLPNSTIKIISVFVTQL